jgi:photosystem II reaction center protein PsbM
LSIRKHVLSFRRQKHDSHFFFLFFLVVTKAAFAKGAAFAAPVAFLSAPAFAMDSIVELLPTTSLSLEVQFGAYLAVLLGTFLPCLFLINLFISTETRKAGAEDALNGKDF